MEMPSGVMSSLTESSSFSVKSVCRAFKKSWFIRRNMANSTAEAESKFPSLLLSASVLVLGMMPTESLVNEEKGWAKARATASLILWSCEVSHRTMNKRHHGRHEIRVSHLPGAAMMSLLFHKFVPAYLAGVWFSAFNIVSSPSALGLTSLGSPRRATSTAMMGDIPPANPMTDAAMHRM